MVGSLDFTYQYINTRPLIPFNDLVPDMGLAPVGVLAEDGLPLFLGQFVKCVDLNSVSVLAGIPLIFDVHQLQCNYRNYESRFSPAKWRHYGKTSTSKRR